ncbi:N-acetyltransferase [Ramlibacter henchirensis]|uniref:N-acetyltransferase n=1 Tax=Ramlibacter henchirensis TaxID=204072 RepID=A0A4Z0BSE9_9BURK|nr:N-acetyltransferase [Ramlibacter henchirensis]TFZ00929.1 N-acetyltransferase [Ramlibacter henchirensis]
MGRVFAFELHNRLIGTIRLVPLGHGLTLTEQLLQISHPQALSHWPKAWDAGRLVIAPEYRVGQDVLKRCLHLTLTDLLEHADVENLVGSCTHILSRLYRRFGFNLVARDVLLPGTEKTYCLIHGEVERVRDALAPSAIEA